MNGENAAAGRQQFVSSSIMRLNLFHPMIIFCCNLIYFMVLIFCNRYNISTPTVNILVTSTNGKRVSSLFNNDTIQSIFQEVKNLWGDATIG